MKKYNAPNNAEIIRRLEVVYKEKDKKKFMAEYAWCKAVLTEPEIRHIDNMIDCEKILREMRTAYIGNDFYEMDRLVQENGWLLSDDKLQEVLKAQKNITPSELIQYAYKIFNNK